MRRILCALLAAVLLLGLSGCRGGDTPADTPADIPADTPADTPEETQDLSASALLDAAALAGGVPEHMQRLTGDEASECAESRYGLDAAWTDCAVLLPQGAQASELAVFRMADDADSEAAAAALEEYRAARVADFFGYEPAQAEIADRGAAVSQGRWAALLICEDPDSAVQAFSDALEDGTLAQEPSQEPSQEPGAGADPVTMPDRYPYTPPGKDDMTPYDTTAILAAWESGDDSALDSRDREILSRCREILDLLITDGMTDLEKESALYWWVTTQAVYDEDHYNPQVELSRDAYTPYGLLVNGKGVCLAFATTFQLLMDLAGVECITVIGAAYHSSEDHAWNMVRLDGKWYCADPTWDASGFWPDGMGYDPDYVWRYCVYFNVSSQYMADSDHQWDYTAVPETDF